MSSLIHRGFAFRLLQAATLAAVSCLAAISTARAAPGADADGDAAAIETCLAEPAMSGRDPRECGERLFHACLSAAGDAGRTILGAVSCETRRGEAWNVIARRTYRQIEAKLGDAEKRLLRTSQVQFELELSDLCRATRTIAGSDPALAEAVCTSALIASHALDLSRLAGGRDAAKP
jgi:hypothetical protein